MNASAFNAGINARAKLNNTAARAAEQAVDSAKYFGGAVKFGAQSAASFVKGFFNRSTPLEVVEPTITLTEAELKAIVEAEVARRAESAKPRARKANLEPIAPKTAAAKRAMSKVSK